MPNWCKNRVDFYSENTKDLEKIFNIFSDKESIFGQIIPEPDWKTTPNDKGELPFKDPSEPMFPPKFPDGTVDDRWYNWRIANWDTKWDACDVDIEEERYGELNKLECFTAEFETAWSPPEAICHALREMFPDVSISWFFDEPGMEVAGYL